MFQDDLLSGIRLFVSYSHRDDRLRQELYKHLAQLRRSGFIKLWSDCEIRAGANLDFEIRAQLEIADIVLLLVSSDFLNSEYCYSVELKRAIERHHSGLVRIIPIILRPCDWQSSPLESLRAIPKDGRAVATWANRDAAFLDAAKEIRKVVQDLIPSRRTSADADKKV